MSKVSLGQMVDTYYKAREERLALAKRLEELKALEDKAEKILLDALRAQGLEGCKGSVAVAAIKRNVFVDVQDEDAFKNYILDTRDLSLLQFRPSVTALRERWDAGEAVPGVRRGEKESISLTKAGGR
jgi:hypothetical protein